MPRSGSGRDMGLGTLGGATIVFKRKYRWTFEVDWNNKIIPEHFVKLAARPNLTIEETEINWMHGKTWIPGKGTWETITVTYYDIGNAAGSGFDVLYSWLSTVYNFTDPIGLHQSSKRGTGSGYGATCNLTLYDGCGVSMEEWKLKNAWPQSINFGELDYSSSDDVNIELTIRYSDVQYLNTCGPNPTPLCGGC